MKYSVEYKNCKFIETLEVDGHTATKTWKRENGEDISGLRSHDKEFSEQLEELLDEEVLDSIYDLFDNSMLIADIEDFILHNNVE